MPSSFGVNRSFTMLRVPPYVGSQLASTFDPDALAYFSAAGITDSTQKSAANTFIIWAKANTMNSGGSFWTNFIRLFLFLGATSSTNSYCARTLNQGVFHGGMTYANGITGNGTDAYFDTGYNLSGLTMNNNAFSLYDRSTASSTKIVLCASDRSGGDGEILECSLNNAGTATVENGYYFGGGAYAFTVTNQKGFWVFSRTLAQVNKTYIDGVLRATGPVADQWFPSAPNQNMFLLSSTTPDSFCSDNLAFFAISSPGMSAADVSALNTAVVNFETTLGRA